MLHHFKTHVIVCYVDNHNFLWPVSSVYFVEGIFLIDSVTNTRKLFVRIVDFLMRNVREGSRSW